jgi:nicotinamidase-related amidase
MPKDRIEDTFAYLNARATAGELPNLKAHDVGAFKTLVEQDDRTNGGAALSLNWSWYNTRPSESVRHAIRGYLLASIYSGDVTATATAAEATLVKQRNAGWLHTRIARRLSDVLGLSDRANINAVDYMLQARGAGTRRAKATCISENYPIPQLMEGYGKLERTAIVLIDMQSEGDVGQHRYYGDQTVLQHQQAVLRKAAELKWIVYDIVIDPGGAAEWGNAYALSDLSSKTRGEIMERQRRPSYARDANIKTIGLLSNLYTGARVRHIPKPSHPTFVGTLFGDHLEDDGVKSVIVMGYDANQCVKATVFGVPSETREEAEREPTGKEVEAVMKEFPNLTVQAAQKRATPTKTVTTPYTPGLLDRGVDVITARCVLASGYAPLDPEWARLSERR